MSRISDKFKELKKQGKKALITFITAGDPGLSVTEKLVYELEKSGADIIELGIPFSDPLADGPTIQASHLRALKTSTVEIIKLVSKIRKKSQVPIAFMVSYNLIMKYGIEKFVKDSVKAGADGVIVPDLPPEESDILKKASKANGLDTVFLVAPTSTKERIKEAGDSSTGFIYLVSLTGITGERKAVPENVKNLIETLRKQVKKPIAVGFGISKPEHVKDICKYADGAIVGSAIVRVIEKNLGKKSLVKNVGRIVQTLAGAAHKKI